MKKILFCLFLSSLVMTIAGNSFQLMNSWTVMDVAKEPEPVAFLFLTYFPSYYLTLDGVRFEFNFVHPSPGTMLVLQDQNIDPAGSLMKPSGRMLLLAPRHYPVYDFNTRDQALQSFYSSKLYSEYGAELYTAAQEIEKLNYSSWSLVRGFAAVGGTGLLIWGGCEMLARYIGENPDYLFPSLLVGAGAALVLSVNLSFIIDDARITGLLKNLVDKAAE